jgi:hypothetical protein
MMCPFVEELGEEDTIVKIDVVSSGRIVRRYGRKEIEWEGKLG